MKKPIVLPETIKTFILAAVQMGYAAAKEGKSEEQVLNEARKTLNQGLYQNCLSEAMKAA